MVLYTIVLYYVHSIYVHVCVYRHLVIRSCLPAFLLQLSTSYMDIHKTRSRVKRNNDNESELWLYYTFASKKFYHTACTKRYIYKAPEYC